MDKVPGSNTYRPTVSSFIHTVPWTVCVVWVSSSFSPSYNPKIYICIRIGWSRFSMMSRMYMVEISLLPMPLRHTFTVTLQRSYHSWIYSRNLFDSNLISLPCIDFRRSRSTPKLAGFPFCKIPSPLPPALPKLKYPISTRFWTTPTVD